MESSSAITVQWGQVEPCDQQNGAITGYSVRYGEVETSVGERRVEIASGNSSSTISGLTKKTVYTVEVAAETSGGTGVYSEPLTIETPDSECAFWLWHSSLLISSTDVYISLYGEVIPNHGYVEISDIGYSYRTALFCHTNRPAIRSYTSYLVGKWFTPERDRVEYFYDLPGFWSEIDQTAVRLFRSTYGTADVGIFVCEIKDATETLQTVYVGLYHSGEGIASFSEIRINVHCIFIISPSTKLSQVSFRYQLVFQPLTSMEVVLSSPSPVSPLVDLLPLSLGPETQSLSLKELRLC